MLSDAGIDFPYKRTPGMSDPPFRSFKFDKREDFSSLRSVPVAKFKSLLATSFVAQGQLFERYRCDALA